MESKKDQLMEEAKQLGLNPHHNVGELKLQEMINEALEPKVKVSDASGEPEAIEETKPERMKRLRDEQREQIRVIIRCHNDNKSELTGETHTIICAAGTIRKWVPFDNEEGWHVPQAILSVLEAKVCQKFKNGKLKNGQPHKVSFMTKEYTIEKMKPLSKKELDSLAKDQSARGSID